MAIIVPKVTLGTNLEILRDIKNILSENFPELTVTHCGDDFKIVHYEDSKIGFYVTKKQSDIYERINGIQNIVANTVHFQYASSSIFSCGFNDWIAYEVMFMIAEFYKSSYVNNVVWCWTDISNVPRLKTYFSYYVYHSFMLEPVLALWEVRCFLDTLKLIPDNMQHYLGLDELVKKIPDPKAGDF